jgi:U4/U6.U5 tri-snRNP-associated protein 2
MVNDVSNMSEEPVNKRLKTESIKPVELKAPETVSLTRTDVDSDEEDVKSTAVLNKSLQSRNCPYLDTINRNVLDFDFEKLCSISLSKINVYACLVCGKYFQGRGIGTFAHTHSVAVDHHVFLNLNTLKFYCLPDNYEILDSSLG